MARHGSFSEAFHPNTSAARRTELHEQLLRNCKLDAYAMIKIWQNFANMQHLKI